ncbi:MAG: class III extradiol ring-cleavage dioxygenase [Aquisalimonadaceae bacterium]
MGTDNLTTMTERAMHLPTPTIFVSHGAPTLALSSAPAHGFLQKLGEDLGRPRAIVVVSPHWQTNDFAIRAPERFRTWHDFRGFPRELYELRYEPPGDTRLAEQILQRLQAAGLPSHLDQDRDLDHGAWVPLSLMYPQADIPVVQISLSAGGPAAHLQLGEALRWLADEGVLLLTSGSAVHNLGELHPEDAPAQDWAVAFDRWLESALTSNDTAALLGFDEQAPEARRAHPDPDHLMPLFVARGAGGHARRLHDSFTYGTLSMAAYSMQPA